MVKLNVNKIMSDTAYEMQLAIKAESGGVLQIKVILKLQKMETDLIKYCEKRSLLTVSFKSN